MNNALTTSADTPETKLVTLHVNGSWWPTQFVTERTSQFRAVRSRFVVRSPHGVEHTGAWRDRAHATRFANSIGPIDVSLATNHANIEHNPWLNTDYACASVHEVEPYWYVPHFGPVP